MDDSPQYPMRINKYLAWQKFASRREADELIKNGQVFINNIPAVLGSLVEENDKVEVRNFKKDFVYIAYYKPRGIITHSPQGKEKSIADVFHFPQKIYPIGRLDKDSHGLIILTNDGLVTERLLHPDKKHDKEYVVKVNKTLSVDFANKMSEGVVLDDGYLTRPCVVTKISNNTFKIILTEGKKRQIRRMCQSLGFKVIDLKRIRIMNVEIGKLQPNEGRILKNEELVVFLRSLGLQSIR